MADNVIFEIPRLEEFRFEEVIRSELAGIHENRPEHIRSHTAAERRDALFTDHPEKRIKTILIIEPLLRRFREVALEADHNDFGRIPYEPGYSSRHAACTS